MTDDITRLLQQALTLHQQGKLAAAEILYQQILQRQPRHFDAMHFSGLIAKQRGALPTALELIAAAIAIDATQANAHCNLGAVWQELGNVEAALGSYDTAIRLRPEYAMAHHNRGNALRKLGAFEQAVASYDQALRIVPDYAEAHCNRAIALQLAGHADESLMGITRALRLKPAYAEAHCAQGVSLQSLQRHAEAIQSYQAALEIRPDYAEAYCNMGTALHRLLRFEEALSCYDCALKLRPEYANAHHYRGNVLSILQRHPEAIRAYSTALENGADAELIHYALAALGETDAPTSAPPRYVKELFDQYADHFDQHLQEVLRYDIPQHIADKISFVQTGATVLDLGCGTGLCGPHLRPYASVLTGVDLSQKMLDKAKQRQIYDHLHCAELTVFLADKRDAYDLIVAADVFVYIGDLLPVLTLVRKALRAGGVFCFSVEVLAEGDYFLQTSNRFAHSRTYIQRLASRCDLTVQSCDEKLTRIERNTQISSYLFLLQANLA